MEVLARPHPVAQASSWAPGPAVTTPFLGRSCRHFGRASPSPTGAEPPALLPRHSARPSTLDQPPHPPHPGSLFLRITSQNKPPAHNAFSQALLLPGKI